MTPFAADIAVRFQHTDPAGLVFYPRYFEMINQVVEDWFAGPLGLDFRTLHQDNGHGVPAVHIEADFPRPSRLGDVLGFTLGVQRLGRSSATLDIAASCCGEERLRATVVLSYAALAEMRAVPLPGALRDAMARFLAPGTPSGAAA